MLVFHLYGMTFYGYTTLALKIHIVQDLIDQLLLSQGVSNLNESVRQGAFSVVNMSYDAKISNLIH